MRSVERSMIAIGVAVIAVFGGVSAAAAKPGPGPVLEIAPARPAAKTPITVSFKAPRLTESTWYYGAKLSVGSTYSPVPCISDEFPVVALRAARGGTFTATLKPRVIDPRIRRWCNGVARVEVRRYGPWPWYTHVLAVRHFRVGTGKADPAPPVAVPVAPPTELPVKMTVLAGSTITASAPGRPDRSSPVTGTFRGSMPAQFQPNTDLRLTFTTGGLVPAAFPADPLCPGTTAPASFDLAAASPQTLFKSGDASMALVLNGAPSQLFGCGPGGPLAGTTTIPLSGKAVKGVSYPWPLSGSVSGIPLPGGSTGGLTANLTVTIDLSGLG